MSDINAAAAATTTGSKSTGKLSRAQMLEVLQKYSTHMNSNEFRARITDHIKERRVQGPNDMMDELENIQRILWAEWDMFPELKLAPEEVMDELHNAAKNFAGDKEIQLVMGRYCGLIEAIVNYLLGVANPGTAGQWHAADGAGGAHGHSHNGVPCHGHGAPQQQPAHGHSHNGVPCHGHGHGGGGAPGGMSPEQFAMMNSAIQNALSEEERMFVADTQRRMMQGKQPAPEDAPKMMEIQSKIMAYVQTMQEMMQMQMQMMNDDAGGNAEGAPKKQ